MRRARARSSTSSRDDDRTRPDDRRKIRVEPEAPGRYHRGMPQNEPVILAVPSTVADAVRQTRRDTYGHHDLAPYRVTEPHSAPCRVCLRDADVGEDVLLFGYSPFAGPHPYRTVGPIFVHLTPCAPYDSATGVPAALRRRLLSVRVHDRAGRMLDAEVTPGDQIRELAERFLALPAAHELHVHHARPGCFACRIVRSVAP